jgi:hypothetical protein
MWNLDGHLASIAQVGCTEYRGHAAGGDAIIDAVVVEFRANFERGHHTSKENRKEDKEYVKKR